RPWLPGKSRAEEIAEAVGDDAVADALERLHDMGMMAGDQPHAMACQPARQRPCRLSRKMPELPVPMRHGTQEIDACARPQQPFRRIASHGNPRSKFGLFSVAPKRESGEADHQRAGGMALDRPAGTGADG